MPREGRPRWLAPRSFWRLRHGGRRFYSKGIGPRDYATAEAWADVILAA